MRRDVASKMAQIHNSKLLLGSATPSMEMMELVETKKDWLCGFR